MTGARTTAPVSAEADHRPEALSAEVYAQRIAVVRGAPRASGPTTSTMPPRAALPCAAHPWRRGAAWLEPVRVERYAERVRSLWDLVTRPGRGGA